MTTNSNTTQRGYGWAHQQRRRQWARIIATHGGAPCSRCGEWIYPGEPWHLDHDDADRAAYLGPSHERCNTSAGGSKARGKTRDLPKVEPTTQVTSLQW